MKSLMKILHYLLFIWNCRHLLHRIVSMHLLLGLLSRGISLSICSKSPRWVCFVDSLTNLFLIVKDPDKFFYVNPFIGIHVQALVDHELEVLTHMPGIGHPKLAHIGDAVHHIPAPIERLPHHHLIERDA